MLKKLTQVVVLCALIWAFTGAIAHASSRAVRIHALDIGCIDEGGGGCVQDGLRCVETLPDGHYCGYDDNDVCACLPPA
jgi:hypothetical protein